MIKHIVRIAIRNHSALNLCMVATMLVGAMCLNLMHRESFPEFELDRIMVMVPYPGAAPQETEEGVGQKIEEAVRSIEGIKKVTTVAQEGSCTVLLELIPGGRLPDRVLDEVRSGVERIPSFPLEAEDPQITLVTNRRPSIRVGLIAPDSAARQPNGALTIGEQLRLREVAERVRDDLLALPSVAQVDYLAARDYQIDIEIPEAALRSHGLTLKQAADIIRRENRELPAGGHTKSVSRSVVKRQQSED